uniref:Zinc knuckle CX2CX4HX4C n=1 Tax=Tanacetum cinerariifolium TaxID=118510 RepID=A0A6L2N938_TANCI|nr:zinc knuckle CX2CX4HX4C [Tanacetum cinerariifolium]
MNGGNAKSDGKGSLNVAYGSSSNTHIIDKINKLERKILEGKQMFVDDDENPLVPTGNVDSDSEVEVVFDETANLMASTYITTVGVDINTLTMKQYLALSREKQAPNMVKPEIRDNVNFENKSQFMRELRKDTFFENKNEDAHDHVDRVLNIIRAVNTWDLFNKAFIQRNISNNSNTDGLAVIVSKLDNLGRDMKKLKENVHAIQVGCQICEGPHLDKECPLNEEVKQLEEVKYREFRYFAPFNRSNGAKFRMGPPRYYTRTNNRPPYWEKRPSLEKLMNKYQEESARRNAKRKEWFKKLQENAQINTKNQSASVHVMPRNTFEYLRLANLRNTNMLVKMADMMKKAPLGTWDRKKGHMLDKIWEYCKHVHRNSTYQWHDHGFEEEEHDEMGIEIEKYDPPKVQRKKWIKIERNDLEGVSYEHQR